MKIYLVRHAQSVGNKQRLMQGDLDYTLSEKGRKQAEELKHKLPKFDKIYSSRLLRAAETARIVTGKDPNFVNSFSELNIGNISGKPYKDDMDDHDQRIQYFYLDDTNDYHEKVNGESIKDFVHRVSKAFSEIVYGCDPDDIIGIFTHGGTMRAILYKYLGILDSEDADFQNGEVIVLKYTDGLYELIERITL